LTNTFYNAFSQYLISKGIQTVELEFGKIDRCQTYTEDYGALSADDRFNLIKNDTYMLNTIPTKDDLCIFIDDISITGTHQRVIENLLDSNKINTNSFFLYFSILDNSSICPTIENYLNYSFIDEFNKLIDLIISDDYLITTRSTKYILSQKKENLEMLISSLITKNKFKIIKEIVTMSYSNEYNKIEAYQQNLHHLKLYIDKTKLNR
jgi:hypothetical protein